MTTFPNSFTSYNQSQDVDKEEVYVFPASSAQQRLWFQQQLLPQSPFYNIPLALTLRGDLDFPTLERSLNTIVQRHEALRTSLEMHDGRLMQLITPQQTLDLTQYDLRGLPGEQRGQEQQRILEQEATRPFNLSQSPLMRACLLFLDDQETVLLLNWHHSIFDGWSQDIFMRELTQLYRAFHQGNPSLLPDLPIQYADYAHWQEARIEASTSLAQQHLAYWREQLRDAPSQLNLPTDHPRPAISTFQGARQQFAFPKRLYQELQQLSQQEEATLFMTMLASFQVLLARYSQQKDIVIGTPAANRVHPDSHQIISCCINMIAIRTDLSGTPGFREVLHRLRSVVLSALDYQELPFEQVVETLQVQRTPGMHPLFQVQLVLQQHQYYPEEMGGLQVSAQEIGTNSAKLDLTIELREDTEGLRGHIDYNTDLFERDTIERLVNHWQVLLEGITEHPDTPIYLLPILTAQERHQIVIEWNQTQRDYPRDRCIHQLFEEQAAQTPEAVAVIYGDEQLTYLELNQRANQLAHYLHQQGIEPDALIGICLERSLDLIVGLLGILKAGGGYVPLDPSYPRERLDFMVADTHLQIIITHSQFKDIFTGSVSPLMQTLVLDQHWPLCEAQPTTNLECLSSSENLACVLYTSGSTGTPKGVMIPHRAVNRLVCNTDYLQINSAHRVAHASNISFDAATFEIWGALLNGARLIILSKGVLLSTSELAATLRQQAIDVLFLTTALFNVLVETAPDVLTSISHLLTGGEAANPHSMRKALQYIPTDGLLNVYGPTENTTLSSWFNVNSIANEAETVSIGRPIANSRMYILDASLQPVPIGVPGELYLGGDGLARGYLNRPDLTAERFISDRLSDIPEARLYKTGDLARYLPDGNVEFLGRLDHQIKLRGFRIELGEIETALNQHPAVRESMSLLKEDAIRGKYLIAYVVSAQRPLPTEKELRTFLQQWLPEYMVPSALVALDHWPVTPNGKINRNALPEPVWSHTKQPDTSVAPRTPLEQMIAKVWCEVLDIKQVGIHDNFFQLGGHSLLTMQLASRLSVLLDRKISVKTIFTQPTVAQLAEMLQAEMLLDTNGMQTKREPAIPHRASSKEKQRRPEPLSHAYTVFERRPLLSLISTGKVAPVDAVALSYLLPWEFAREDPNTVVHEMFQDMPILTNISETTLGRIGEIVLPIFHDDIYLDQRHLIDLCIEALDMAKSIGAQTASLTGLLPSATDYGQTLVNALGGRTDLPRITTGHATTTSAVVLTIQRMLQEGGRVMSRERVGFLGLGSIGLTTLRLMLTVLPHPHELLLCDLYSRRETLEAVRHEVLTQFGFQGTIRILEAAKESMPNDFYSATFVVGATNVADVLDIDRVQPGTMIVDDSGPHCIRVQRAIQRLQTRGDVLFSEGGVLQSTDAITQLTYLPRTWEAALDDNERARLAKRNPYEIMGCGFSSALSNHFKDLALTIGQVETTVSQQHYNRLRELGFQGGSLQCEQYTLSAEYIQAFRQRFSRSRV
jgi:amino acid adenylation domain-containing protein